MNNLSKSITTLFAVTALVASSGEGISGNNSKQFKDKEGNIGLTVDLAKACTVDKTTVSVYYQEYINNLDINEVGAAFIPSQLAADYNNVCVAYIKLIDYLKAFPDAVPNLTPEEYDKLFSLIDDFKGKVGLYNTKFIQYIESLDENSFVKFVSQNIKKMSTDKGLKDYFENLSLTDYEYKPLLLISELAKRQEYAQLISNSKMSVLSFFKDPNTLYYDGRIISPLDLVLLLAIRTTDVGPGSPDYEYITNYLKDILKEGEILVETGSVGSLDKGMLTVLLAYEINYANSNLIGNLEKTDFKEIHDLVSKFSKEIKIDEKVLMELIINEYKNTDLQQAFTFNAIPWIAYYEPDFGSNHKPEFKTLIMNFESLKMLVKVRNILSKYGISDPTYKISFSYYIKAIKLLSTITGMPFTISEDTIKGLGYSMGTIYEYIEVMVAFSEGDTDNLPPLDGLFVYIFMNRQDGRDTVLMEALNRNIVDIKEVALLYKKETIEFLNKLNIHSDSPSYIDYIKTIFDLLLYNDTLTSDDAKPLLDNLLLKLDKEYILDSTQDIDAKSTRLRNFEYLYNAVKYFTARTYIPELYNSLLLRSISDDYLFQKILLLGKLTIYADKNRENPQGTISSDVQSTRDELFDKLISAQ